MADTEQGNSQEFILLVFKRNHCSVCHAIEPKLKELFSRYALIQVKWIDVEENPELAGQYLIFTVPAVLFLYEGKEQFRLVRNFALSELEQKIDKILQYF